MFLKAESPTYPNRETARSGFRSFIRMLSHARYL
jgi:hypothetical protein